jgi:thiamine-monophosphate kinase
MRSEFKFINNLKAKYGLTRVGDDCAVISKDAKTDLLITSDMLVEDIDFRLEWTSPEFLGHKALAVSLSDIAAMGGRPAWALLSIGLPENLWNSDFLERFYSGWFLLASNYGVELVGGDISRSPDKIVIDSILGGEVGAGRAILRSNAKPGDSIFVSGTLGGASGGLSLLESGSRHSESGSDSCRNLIARQLHPIPKIIQATLLETLGIVTSMIDVSDGLSSDIGHLCQQSAVGAMITIAKVPIDENLIHHFSPDVGLEMALNGGEDFELLFTADHEYTLMLETNGFTHIGRITEEAGGILLVTPESSVLFRPHGYRHF